MTNLQITPFPQKSLFMNAGIRVRKMMEIEKRWPVLTEAEKQQVLRRIIPLIDKSLDDILK